MKKRNCRMTDEERALHDRAVSLRKLPDRQLCERVDSCDGKDRRTVVDAALRCLAVRDKDGNRIADATLRKIREMLETRGFYRA